MARERTKLVLGRGEVYFDRFLPGTQSGEGERYLGNTPSFQITRRIERLERATSYLGRRHDQPGAVISESVTVSMVTDHMASENVSMWFSDDGTDVTDGLELVPYTENFVVRLGRFYQLGSNEVHGGFRFVEAVQILVGATVLTAGIDYVLERDSGRIEILSTAVNVSNGQTITVNYVKRPNTLRIAESKSVEYLGLLRYISKNPYGPKVDYLFPQVRISPRGAVEMKGDEFRQMQFDVTALKKNPSEPLLYATHIGAAPLPITADTTLITADTTFYTADNDDAG